MRIGVDLGGTKIEVVALDDDGGERYRRRIATPRGSYPDTVAAIRELVAGAEASVGTATVGVCIPGAISPATGLVKNANSTWLNGRPLKEDLAAAIGREVRLANDANCFALSEATDGAARDAHVVFGVILGTGTGGGVVIGGRAVRGAHAIAGEWGHNPMPGPEPDEWPGTPCYCGRSGCIETVLSGPALARDYAARGGDAVDARELAARAAAGEALAVDCLEHYERRLARALASIINTLDPDAIVLGGGLSNISRLYDRVPRLWQEFVFSDVVTTPLLRAEHGDSSGVRGAAWLWPKREHNGQG